MTQIASPIGIDLIEMKKNWSRKSRTWRCRQDYFNPSPVRPNPQKVQRRHLGRTGASEKKLQQIVFRYFVFHLLLLTLFFLQLNQFYSSGHRWGLSMSHSTATAKSQPYIPPGLSCTNRENCYVCTDNKPTFRCPSDLHPGWGEDQIQTDVPTTAKVPSSVDLNIPAIWKIQKYLIQVLG